MLGRRRRVSTRRADVPGVCPMIGIGVVGMGFMGRRHALNTTWLEGCGLPGRLVGVCSAGVRSFADLEVGGTAGNIAASEDTWPEGRGSRVAPTYADLLADSEVDAVVASGAKPPVRSRRCAGSSRVWCSSHRAAPSCRKRPRRNAPRMRLGTPASATTIRRSDRARAAGTTAPTRRKACRRGRRDPPGEAPRSRRRDEEAWMSRGPACQTVPMRGSGHNAPEPPRRVHWCDTPRPRRSPWRQ